MKMLTEELHQTSDDLIVANADILLVCFILENNSLQCNDKHAYYLLGVDDKVGEPSW